MAAYASRNTKKAVPLCLPNNLMWNPRTHQIQDTKEKRHSLYVVDEAVAELRKIKGPVSVVAIAGPCRDGKSFILSEVFRQTNVFPVGFKMDPETMGIWMWILPSKMQDRSGREFSVVLLDSEGIDSPMVEGREDKQIFIMTVLLASVLIYNSKGVPKRNDLNELEFVARLSQQIRATSNRGTPGTKNEDAFHKTFPFFIWLLRDVMTDIPDDCTGIKDFFLKRIFKGPASGSHSTKVDSTQEIADSILHFFAGFDAFCLPPPAFNKNLMKDIEKNRDKMNPDFFPEVNQFERLLKSYVGPKKSFNEGEYVTGEALDDLTRLYVNAINDPQSIPNVQSTWETHVQRKCEDAKTKALEVYDKKMASDLFKLPCDGEKILASHEAAIGQASAIFRQETSAFAFEHARKDYERFMNLTTEKLSEWKNKNDALTKQSCEKYLEELKRKYFDPVLARVRGPSRSSVSYKEFDDACAKIEKDYKAYAVGAKNVRAQVFREFHERLKEETEHYKELLKKLKDYDETLMKARRENAIKDEEAKNLREKNQYLEKEMKIQEQQLKEVEKKKMKELEDQLKEFKMKEEILQNKIGDMEKAGMEDKIRTLSDELRDAREESRQRDLEMDKLTQQIANLAEQLRLANRPWYTRWFGIGE